MYYIYKITNTINNKIYVGRGTVRTKKYGPEKDQYYGSGVLIKRSVKKYGKEFFRKEILEYCGEDRYFADEREIFWIKELNSLDPDTGYNLVKGGQGFDTESSKIAYSKITEEGKLRSMEAMRVRMSTEEGRAEVSEYSKKMWEKRSEGEKEEVIRKMKEYWASGGSDKRKKYMKELLSDPIRSQQYRDNLSKGVRKAIEKDPTFLERLKETSIRTKEERSKKLKKLYSECPLYQELHRKHNYPKSQLGKRLEKGEITEEDIQRIKEELSIIKKDIMDKIKIWRREHGYDD